MALESQSTYIEKLKSNIKASVLAKQAFFENQAQLQEFHRAVSVLVTCYRNGGRLYIAGNGGSAADSQHLAAEFVSKLARPRAPMPAEALTVDTSALTAIGNDFGYDQVFSRQIAGKMRKEDVFLAITTSGKSANILKALETCREKGITSILLSGRDGAAAKPLADYCILAPGETTSSIQEVHMVIYHSLCECVELEIFPL
jgi:D-sedoheptulose 7-phosphate isomerase